MSPRSKREYLEAISERYKRASLKKKTIILNEFCQNCSYHRKHAIRLLNNHNKPTKLIEPKNIGRPKIYDNPKLLEPLKRIWLAANLPCSKRLKAILAIWLPSYIQEFGEVDPGIVKLLLKISSSSIDKLLKRARLKYRIHGRATTKPGALLKKHIPIKTNQWDETRPGFLEADTVAHCGESLLGSFAYTIDFVDIATGWTEQRATWGKGEAGVLEQVKDIESSLPFSILGFDSDNGNEFLNYHLLRYFTQRRKPIQFTRSRSYHKDDNAHIEQKNWTHVRQWLGYYRLDNFKVIRAMNELYTKEWRLYHNFFLPSSKLLEKKLVASKTLKRYDSPKTPYERLLESPFIDISIKKALKEQFVTLNPFRLRKAMEKKLKYIFTICYPSRI